MLLELRRRLFTHFQRLDIRFHDRYTTGRVVSRLTSDIDAIMELLVGGFDGLISAALTMVGVAVLLLTLDFHLGLVCLICFPLVAGAGAVVLHLVGPHLPPRAGDLGPDHRALRRDHDRDPGRAVLPPGAA